MDQGEKEDMNTPSQSQTNTGHNNVQLGDVTDSAVHITQVLLGSWRISAEAQLRDRTPPAMFRELERARKGAHLSYTDLLRAVRTGALSERAGRPVHNPINKLTSALLLVLLLLPMAQLAVLLTMAWPVAARSAHPALFWLTVATTLVSVYVASDFYAPHRTAAKVVRFLGQLPSTPQRRLGNASK